MTAPLRNPSLFKEFDFWMNEHPELKAREQGLYAMDVDKVCFRFSLPEAIKLLLLEYKQKAKQPKAHQLEVIQILDHILKHAMHSGLIIPTLRGDKPLLYYGYHILRMSNTTPTNSEWMTWDNVRIDESDLVQLLLCKKMIVSNKTSNRQTTNDKT